jgi:hypothetical protein
MSQITDNHINDLFAMHGHRSVMYRRGFLQALVSCENITQSEWVRLMVKYRLYPGAKAIAFEKKERG